MIRKFGLLTVAAVGLLTANAYASTDSNYYKQETTSNKNGNKSYQVKEEQHDPETGHYKSYSKKENTAGYDDYSGNEDRPHVSVRAKDHDSDYECNATYNSPSNKNNTYYSSQTTRRNPRSKNLRYYNNKNFDNSQDKCEVPSQVVDALMDFHEGHKAENLTPSGTMYIKGGWNIGKIDSFTAASTLQSIEEMYSGSFSGGSLALGHAGNPGARVELEGVILNKTNKGYSFNILNVKGTFLNGSYDLSTTDVNNPIRISLGVGIGYLWGNSIDGHNFSSPALKGQLGVTYTAYANTIVPYLQLSTMVFNRKTLGPQKVMINMLQIGVMVPFNLSRLQLS